MIKKILISCVIVLTCFASLAFAEDKPPVFVEMFTSEFCPACPPAEKYLSKISQNPNIIALACHVTYFSSKSNLGKEFCSQRQFDYMYSLNEKSQYTPQFVVNGSRAVVGTNPFKVAATILKSSSDNIGRISITETSKDSYSYNLPKIKRGSYEVMIATYLLEQNFRGRAYNNAVDKLTKLGLWDGGQDERSFKPDINKNHKGFVVFVQDKRSGKIVAAGQYQL